VTPLFRHDPDIALRVLTTGMGSKAYPGLRRVLRVFPWYYRLRHKISESNLERDRATVAVTLDRIEQERQGRAYLVGEGFSVADLTAASLVGPVLQPPELIGCRSNCRRIWRTTALCCYGIPLCNGRPASTACIVDTPRKLPGARHVDLNRIRGRQ